jgi:hypothetical protein
MCTGPLLKGSGAAGGAISRFIDCLADGRPFETDIADNLETFRLVEDAYAAAGGSPP